MQKFSARDIQNLVAYLSENISVYAGDNKDQRILIKPGLKITNKKTGLNYTVSSVMKDPEGKGLIISCSREPGVTITITSKDLKYFERT
tara:strand:+ start:199 stop:465 length:267 start_codon:yes stop_codon:yes gene_type:complete